MNGVEYEIALIAALGKPTDMQAVRTVGLVADDFIDPNTKRAFEHLATLETAGAPFPSLEDKSAIFDLEFRGKHSDVLGLAKEVHKHGAQARIKEIILGHKELISTDPDEAAAQLIASLANLKTESGNRARYLDASGQSRLEWLEENARLLSRGGYVGYPFGIPAFDKARVGMLEGNLATIYGKSGLGKSWILAYMTVVAFLHRPDARVLFISPEMSIMETEIRVDVLRMGQASKAISHEGLMRGEIKELERYKTWLATLNEVEDRWITVDSDMSGGFSAGAIFDLVSTYQPDILAIDGFHLLAGLKGQKGWETIKHNADAVKALLKLKSIIGYTVSQENSAEEIGYGRSVYEASDKIFHLREVKGHADRRIITQEKNRGGRPLLYRVHLDFNVDAGRIRELQASDIGVDDDI